MTVAGALAIVATVLVGVWSAAGTGFSPGEEVYAPEVEDVAATAGGGAPDAARFAPGTEEVRVSLRVEDLPGVARFAATVERSGRYSVVGRLLGTDGVVVSGGEAERLSVSGGGVSGVVDFAVRARGGGGLPAGEYTVSVIGGSGGVIARKYFVVGDRQA